MPDALKEYTATQNALAKSMAADARRRHRSYMARMRKIKHMQKLAGLFFILSSIVLAIIAWKSPVTDDNGGVFIPIFAVLGLYLLFTRKIVLR